MTTPREILIEYDAYQRGLKDGYKLGIKHNFRGYQKLLNDFKHWFSQREQAQDEAVHSSASPGTADVRPEG